MSMEFSDRVLILRVGRFRETDLWVRFLSPGRGVVSAFAFGGSRSKRRFSGCLDVFNEVLFSVKSSRGGAYNALQEGVLIRAPRRLRTDWRRLGMAVNCARFVEAFGLAPDGAAKAYALLSGILSLLEEDVEPPASLPLLFRIRMAFDQGYALQLDACARCAKPLAPENGAGFQVREGAFVCRACREAERAGNILGVDHETLDALAHVQEYSPLRWNEGAFSGLPAEVLRNCARVVDAFIEHHVGLRWDRGRFMQV